MDKLQFAYRANRSTQDALLCLTPTATNFIDQVRKPLTMPHVCSLTSHRRSTQYMYQTFFLLFLHVYIKQAYLKNVLKNRSGVV